MTKKKETICPYCQYIQAVYHKDYNFKMCAKCKKAMKDTTYIYKK